jgi:hypothetical protein
MRLTCLVALFAPILLAAPLQAADADANGPKAALKNFYLAMEAGDAASVRGLFHTDNDAEKELADADAAQLTAARALGEAAKNKFAATGDALSKGLPLRDEIARLDAAQVTIDGDAAAIKLAGQTKPLRMIKSDGQWKLSIADYAGATPANIASQTAVLKDFTAVYSAVAADIAADKFPSAQDAQRALQQKVQTVLTNTLQKHPPTTAKTATQPKP